jgi:hypothetical protein
LHHSGGKGQLGRSGQLTHMSKAIVGGAHLESPDRGGQTQKMALRSMPARRQVRNVVLQVVARSAWRARAPGRLNMGEGRPCDPWATRASHIQLHFADILQSVQTLGISATGGLPPSNGFTPIGKGPKKGMNA